jgi:hypothetical protein
MKRTLAFGAVGLLILLSVAQIHGDVARPKESPSPAAGKVVFHTSLSVVPDSKASEARLQISQETLGYIRAALANQPTNESLTRRIAHSPTRTILAGLFLFLSVSFGGVWLVRSGQSRVHKTVAGFLLCVAVLGAAAIITRANAGPPGYVRWVDLPKKLSEGQPTYGTVDIEIMPEGDGMKLIVPLRKQKNPGEE